MTYRIEEAEFALPEGWRDHSMNIFRLPGVKDAALMVTRDPETPIEDPKEYAETQQAVVKAQMANYLPLRSVPLKIDGQPAWLVEFQWRGGAVLLRQRQAYVRHRGIMLIVTLTATLDNVVQHELAWNDFIASMTLREAATPALASTAANDEAPAPIAAPVATYVFALHASERVLQVMTPDQDPNEFCNAVDVEDGRWQFFDNAGQLLRWRMMQPNRRMIFQSKPGTFDVLEPVGAGGAGPTLLQRLDEVAYLKVRGALPDLVHVRQHLERAARAAADAAP